MSTPIFNPPVIIDGLPPQEGRQILHDLGNLLSSAKNYPHSVRPFGVVLVHVTPDKKDSGVLHTTLRVFGRIPTGQSVSAAINALVQHPAMPGGEQTID